MKNFLSFVSVVWASLFLVVGPASAATVIYKVTDYTGGNHGLWVNRFRDGEARFFSFQDDVRLKVNTDDGTGSFVGTAINGDGETAKIVISLSDLIDTIQGTGFEYKREGGVNYDPASDAPDIDFFTSGTGTITIGSVPYNLSSDPFRMQTVFQFGEGANAKNRTELGGSAWLNIDGRDEHWDLNFAMSAVPEPATWLMMILGLGLIGCALRSQSTHARLLAGIA